MKDAFLIADCDSCAKRVLLRYDLADGDLITRCIHCDDRISTNDAIEASTGELAELGYDVPSEAQPHGDRGCRDGQCGVVQPDS